jgi:hypothetical protein
MTNIGDTNDQMDSLRKSISLAFICLEDAELQLRLLLAGRETIKRRKFAGNCRVIKLDQRKAIGEKP